MRNEVERAITFKISDRIIIHKRVLVTGIIIFVELQLLFSQPCSMFTTTATPYFLRFTLLPLCFGSLMTSYDSLHDYTLLLLSFIYSSFTLFYSRNSNLVSF